MLARYREVVETVMRFRNSKERLIRTAVIMLLPRLASFAPERFASTYLQVIDQHAWKPVHCVFSSARFCFSAPSSTPFSSGGNAAPGVGAQKPV